HHFRKVQGFRVGRGSQELGGSFVLGAWAENSLFFEPIGRKQGHVRVDVQMKDGGPVPPFMLKIEAEGPPHAPASVRLSADVEPVRPEIDDLVFQAIATLPTVPAVKDDPGVPVQAIAEALKKADKTIRRSIDRLEAADRILVSGYASRKKALYAVKN